MYTVSENNIKIIDSYKVTKWADMLRILTTIKKETNSNVFNRSMDSLIEEWIAHNRLYKLHIFRSHTKDVDLNYPQKWYEKLIYRILSI